MKRIIPLLGIMVSSAAMAGDAVSVQAPPTVEPFIATENSTCQKSDGSDATGRIAMTAAGLLLSCQNGSWQTQSVTTLAKSGTGEQVLVKNKYLTYSASQEFTGSWSYDPVSAYWTAQMNQDFEMPKPGLLVVSWTANMCRILAGKTVAPDMGNIRQFVEVYDLDSGSVVASVNSTSPNLVDECAAVNPTLSKALESNEKGYRIVAKTSILPSVVNYGQMYHEASTWNAYKEVVQLTPVYIHWQYDVFH